MTPGSINADRLLSRLAALGAIGRDADGRLTRLTASDADKAGRDALAGWIREAGFEVAIDRIGNVFAIWAPPGLSHLAPVMMGSHIDTVVNAGIYDGCYGVLGGLEVMQTLREGGFAPACPLIVGAFTNEEGARFVPDMMGSLVFAGGLALEDALATTDTEGATLGAELQRIGYAGDSDLRLPPPRAYVELHIEQGPVLEHEGLTIGVVETLQAISWQRLTIQGVANHAGTTPTALRQDAGLAAARVVTFLRDVVVGDSATTVATVGQLSLAPHVINVIASRAVLTVDLRDPDEGRLQAAEARLAAFLGELERAEGVTVTAERLARFEPVAFDPGIVALIEAAAAARGLSSRRMTSGAGHDAQMIARIAPAAMIFTPSVAGVSHNPREHTDPADLVAGANVLLDVVARLAGGSN